MRGLVSALAVLAYSSRGVFARALVVGVLAPTSFLAFGTQTASADTGLSASVSYDADGDGSSTVNLSWSTSQSNPSFTLAVR